MPFPRPLLAAAGRALYGEQWQSPLARDLGISDRTMRRWVAGDSPIPDGVRPDLVRLLVERAVAIGGLVELVRG